VYLLKNFENWLITGKDTDKSKEPRFYGPLCILEHFCTTSADTKFCIALAANDSELEATFPLQLQHQTNTN